MSESITPPARSRITGRVAQILNARELVINVGESVGVAKGMKFKVLADTPLEVRDPGTQEVLDTIDREKVRVEVAEVRQKIAICRTFRVITTGGLDLSALSVFSVLNRKSETRPETLQMRDSSLPEPLPEDESYVKTNDRVEEVRDSG